MTENKINDQPTGSVFIRNFDQGIVEALGSVIRTDRIASPVISGEGRLRRGYWVDETFTAPTAVPVIFNNPEDVYEKKIYPSYLITRRDPEPDMARWHNVKQLEYRSGVSGTEETVSGIFSASGFGLVEEKQQAWPFNLYYSIGAYARYEHEAIPMVKRILRAFPYYGSLNVIDSRGETRSYTIFAESGMQDIGEFIDVADRLKAYAVDVRVEGEFDLDDPVIKSTVRTVVNNLGRL